jgi:hypothetical protein
MRSLIFELPQLSFDRSAGRPRIVPLAGTYLRAQKGVIYRYCGRSRWYPDITAPTAEAMAIRANLLAHPTLDEGECCPLLSA